MTCNSIKELFPDILKHPGKYPEAEEHIRNCSDCREELELMRSLSSGLANAFPEPKLEDTVFERMRVLRRLRRERVKQPLVYAAAMAVVLALTLLLPGAFDQKEAEPQFYTYYETETLEAMMAVDLSEGMQISEEEIALYLIEHGSLNTLEEIDI